jgi:hypothetical protein
MSFLIFKNFLAGRSFGYELNPVIGIDNIGKIFTLVVTVDHVDFIQFYLKALDGQLVLLELCAHLLGFPSW